MVQHGTTFSETKPEVCCGGRYPPKRQNSPRSRTEQTCTTDLLICRTHTARSTERWIADRLDEAPYPGNVYKQHPRKIMPKLLLQNAVQLFRKKLFNGITIFSQSVKLKSWTSRYTTTRKNSSEKFYALFHRKRIRARMCTIIAELW